MPLPDPDSHHFDLVDDLVFETYRERVCKNCFSLARESELAPAAKPHDLADENEPPVLSRSARTAFSARRPRDRATTDREARCHDCGSNRIHEVTRPKKIRPEDFETRTVSGKLTSEVLLNRVDSWARNLATTLDRLRAAYGPHAAPAVDANQLCGWARQQLCSEEGPNDINRALRNGVGLEAWKQDYRDRRRRMGLRKNMRTGMWARTSAAKSRAAGYPADLSSRAVGVN